MKKRSFLFASGLALALLLTACGGKTTSSSSKSESQSKSDSAPNSEVSSSLVSSTGVQSSEISSSSIKESSVAPISSTSVGSVTSSEAISSGQQQSTGGQQTTSGGPASSDSSEPGQQETVYKIVSSRTEWNYEYGVSFVDATDPESTTYLEQYKAEFRIYKDEEFKISDGENYFGYDILENKGAFNTDDGGIQNIIARASGQVEVYLKKLNDEGNYSIYINFVPDYYFYVYYDGQYFGASEDEHPEDNPDLVKQYRVDLGNISSGVAIDVADPFKEFLTTNFDMRRDDNANVDEFDGDFYIHNDAQDAFALIYVWQSGYINFFVSGREEEQPSSWAEAYVAIQNAFENDNYQIPSFEVEGAIDYEFEAINKSLTITFPAETDINAKLEALLATVQQLKINEKSYHYSKYHDVYVNIEQDLILDIYTISDTEIYVDFDVYNLEDTQDYGLVLIAELDGNDVHAARFGEPAAENEGFTQYFLDDVFFQEGVRFFAYDFKNEVDFAVSINSASFGGNIDKYIEYDSKEGTYVVKKKFTGDVYIQLKWQQDRLYIGLVSE